MAQFQELVAVLESDPANPGVWQQLEALAPQSLSQADSAGLLEATRKLLRERGELEVVARLFDVEIAAVREPDRRADLLLQKGQLFAEELLNEQGAVACLEEVLKLRPDDETAQETLAHIDLVRENWQKFVQKYLEEARVSTDRQLTTQLYLSAAETYARYQPGTGEIEQYLRRALEVDARNRRAAIHLERLLRNAGRWADLLEHLEQRVEAAASKEERVHALTGIAELAATRLGRPELTLDAMRKVVGHDPAHPRALRVLADHYEKEQNWSALVMLYSNALKAQRRGGAGAGGPEGDAGTLLQIAMLHWKRLGNLDSAEEYFRRLRKIDQAHPAVLAFYREYYGGRNEGSKLLQLLKAAHKATDDKELRRQLAVEIAGMAEGELGNPEKAIESWKAILKNEPDNQGARDALERLYRKTEGWNKLLDLIKEEIGRLPEAETERRIKRLLDVVEIYRDKLKLDVMVINTYNAILKLDPFHRQALDELAEKYKQLGRWNDLIAVLGKKAEDGRAPAAERAANLREVAQLWSERFGNYAQAIRPLEQLLDIDPTDAQARAQLKDIYTRRRQWRALISLLGREVDEQPPAERRAGLVHMAHLAADRLGDQRLAIEIWNRILELHPAQPDGEALTALAGLYDREKRYLALAEILRRQADAARAAGDKAGALAVLEKLGVVYAERLAAPQLAAETLHQVLALVPDNARALRTLRDLHGAAGDWDGLERMYAELGHWDELVDAFIGMSDRIEARDTKMTLLERAARVAAAHFDHPDKIARAWERVLALDPQHREAAAALVPLYRKTEKWGRLLNVLEALLAHAATDAERLDLHLQIRALSEQQLGSKALAFQWTARAFELAPSDPQLLADLERLGAEADAWAEVADILDRRLGAAPPAERLLLLRELGKITLQRLHQPDRARAYQRRVLELAPDDPQAMAALEEIATQLADWPDLLAVYRRRAQLEKDGDARVDLLFRTAFLEEERLADLDAAAATYAAILEVRPDSQRALKALCKIEEARGDWDGLARALERTRRQSDDAAEQLDLLLRLGKLYETNLGRMAEALRCFREAFDLAPHRAEVRDALERFLDTGRIDDDRRVEVAALLLPQYEQRDDAGRIARALEVLHLKATPAAAAEYDRRLVRLYGDRLNDPASAFTASVRLLRALPGDPDARAALLRHGAALDRPREMAAELQTARTAKGLDAGTRRAIAADLARVQEDRLADSAEAEKAWRNVLEDEPADASAYAALDRIYRAAERWQDLRDLLLQQEQNLAPARPGGAVDPARRVEILLQVCEIEEGPLANKAGAVASHRRVLELDPSHLRSYRALERLYEEAEQWKELEALCAAELDHVEGQARIDLTYKRAHLLARHLNEPEAAVDLLQEVVAAQRGHADARELLEELLPKANLRLRIARLLEPLYEQDGLWRDLVLVLRAQREYAGPHEAVDLLSRIARVEEEQLGHERGAFDTWREAFQVDAAEEAPRQALMRLGSLLGRWDEVAEAWEKAVARVPVTDPALRATLLTELADLYDRHLADAARAAGAYERLLEVDPGNPETSRPAALALDRLYSEEQRWPELIDIVHRQAEWAAEPAERCRLLARIAEVQEQRLGDAAAAVATWREVLAEDPEDGAALDALERLYTAAGQARELAEVLHRRVEKAVDPQEKKFHLVRIAGLYERELANPGEAIIAHLEVLDHLPDDRDTLAELARLHRAGQRWPDLYEIVERQLAGAAGDAERIALTYELAVLQQDQLDRPAEALDRLAEVLRAEPRHASALARLEGLLEDRDLAGRAAEVLQPIYEASGENAKLAALLGRTAAVSDDVRERLRALVRVAELREQRLGEPGGAFDAYAQAARVAAAEPELPALLQQLDRLSAALGREGDLIAIFESIAPDVLDGDLQRRMYLDIADLARALRQDVAMARRYYQKVLDAEPEDRRALLALESIHREAGEHARLHDILIRKAEIASTSLDDKVGALAEAAALCAGPLDRTDDAISAWEQVLELVPASKEAASALEQLYEKGGRYHELVGLIERRLGYAYTVEEAVALRFRLGEIHEKHLLAPDAAVDNYAAALGGDPGHAGATTALERALDDPGTRASAAEVLEPIYVAHQDWAKLVRIYEIKLDASENPAERLALTRYISRLYEDQLEDLEGAFRWCGRIFREDPTDESVRDQLMRLATVLESWAAMANIYQEYLDDETADSREVRDIALDLAQLYDRRLGEVELAQAAYRRALRIQPDDPDTFERLESMLVRAGNWYSLVDVYQDGVQATLDDRRRVDLHIRLARMLRDRLNDLPGAVDAFRAALEIEPDHRDAIAELEALFEAQNKWNDLTELLAQRIERAGSDRERVALRLRLADLMEKRLRDPQSAIDQYEQVLATPDGWDQALPSLERLVVDEACRERITEILEPVYRQQDWWQKLVVILHARLDYIDDPARRTAMLREIAGIHERRGGDLHLALTALAEAWKLDPTNEEVGDDLAALAARLGAWDQLVATLEAGIVEQYDYDLVARVLAQIAEIHETKRGDNAAAITAWKRLLEVAEDDPVGLSALDRLYAAEAQWVELVDVVQRRADRAEELPVRRVLLHRVAEIEENELGNLTNAISAWKAALSVDDADREALDALERLYTHEEEWRELATVLGRKIELAADDRERRALRFAAAGVHDGKLKDAYEAIAQLNEVLAAQPADAEALDALAVIQEREKMWPELIETLDRRAALESAPAGRAELAFRAARVVEAELAEPEAALDRYQAVLALHPAHAGARAALDALTRNEDTLERAATVLERLYVAEGGHDAVAALYERRLAGRSGDAEIRQQWYARLAEVHEVARGDLDAAFAVWARALAEAPDRADVQGQLERLAASRGSWEALADIYEKRLHEVVDADLEHLYAAKLGSLYEEAIGDLDRAALRYRRALDVASDERPVLIALDRVYGRGGKFAELADILAREAEAAGESAEQAELWFRLGDVREQNLGDVAAAVAAYREVLERAPRHSAARGALERLLAQDRERAEVIDILEPLYQSEGDWARLLDLLGAKLGVTTDHMDRAQIYARIAELAEAKLNDPVRALDAAGGWLAEDPQSDRALAELQRLGEACGRWDEVAARLAGIIGAADADEVRLPLLLQLGEVELDCLGRAPAAEATFRRVLEIDDESKPALAALDRIYRERGDAAALAEVVWRRGELALDAPHKRRCYVEVAGLREKLGDVDGAIAAWREVLDLDESDRDAHTHLAALHEQKQSWPELIEVLGIAARFAADKAEEASLRARIARIHTRQGQLDEAVDAWQAVLDVAADDQEALAALLDVHTRREDWLAVQDVLVRRLELARANPERIATYTELAELAAGKRDSIDEAIGYLYQVLDIDNAHMPTYARLDEILSGAERWHDLVELMQRKAEVHGALGQTRDEVGCYARAADIWEGQLDNPDAAGEILEKILAREPRYVPALTRLARIYEAQSDWDKCSEILQRAAAMGPTGSDAADLYFRLGEVERQKSGDMEAALRHWAHALQFDPHHAQAVEAFEREAREREDWGVVADMLARREARETDPGKKLALLLDLAELYGKRLAQPQQVVPILEQASRLAPTDPRVIGPLGDAYFAAGDVARAAPIFEKLADEAKAGRRMKDVAMFRQRLGGIFEARGEADKAMAAYEEAFRVNPTDVATMAGLGRIYMNKQDWEKARRVYRSLVLQNIDPSTGITKAEVYYHLGMIHIHLGEAPKAKGMFQRGLELEPNNEALKRALAQAG